MGWHVSGDHISTLVTSQWPGLLSFYEFSIKEYSWELYLNSHGECMISGHITGPWHQVIMGHGNIQHLVLTSPHWSSLFHWPCITTSHQKFTTITSSRTFYYILLTLILIWHRIDNHKDPCLRLSHYYLLFIPGCSITSRGYIMFNQSMKLKHWPPYKSKYLASRAYQVAVMQF